MMAQIWAWVIAKTRDEEGQALVEYGLILALIAIIAIVALSFLGGSVNNTLNTVANKVGGA
ncbi:MAG: Flp family type IVb pilin [Thermaerobacter sp.]|nr:Flp family type IVb pilin [Thermaerobacter sp.]